MQKIIFLNGCKKGLLEECELPDNGVHGVYVTSVIYMKNSFSIQQWKLKKKIVSDFLAVEGVYDTHFLGLNAHFYIIISMKRNFKRRIYCTLPGNW